MEQLSKYLDNKNFIKWVFQPDAELEIWWIQFEAEHPEEKTNLQLARKMLLNLRTSDTDLTEEKKRLIFSRILKQMEERQQSGRTKRFIFSFLSYAAVALLFFTTGALLFYKQGQFIPQQFNQEFSIPVADNSAKLIRANGEHILLKEDKSILQYHTDGKLVVNNDTIKTERINSEKSVAMNQLIIPYGKSSKIILSDGTTVYLNAGSRLMYPEKFFGKTREVILVGEAFFNVSQDLEYPFIVQVSDLRIKVLGTKFNISAYPSDLVIETVVAEGKVSMKENNAGLFDKTTEVMPDQLASFDKNSKNIEVKKVNSANYAVWTMGILQFESTDLLRITNRLERYYNIKFEYDEPLLGKLLISGKMELKEDKEEICDRLAHTAAVKIVKKEDGLYEILQ